ncbi:MAG: Riboflavin biosynthesis protein RibF [Verrucomicrobia subdivision 3 bacterium]|nr:Riboflavin biosynthesis protein RibF [Limisphaerales bacterium]MCS1412957.1 Riboflavin biosynthesis protein RibF [Limisphaerales bacterium]
MKIIRQLGEFENPLHKATFCTIGMFDGLHLGHQHVIKQTIHRAQQADGISIAITFDQHPARIVAPERAPAMIYPLSKRRALLEASNFSFVWIIPFDRQFSEIPGNEFLERITKWLSPLCYICVGPDFHFGHKRSGDPQLLRDRASSLDYELPEIIPVKHQGGEVSSTAIRNLITEGKLDEASHRLGRNYEICGQVVRGKEVGRSIGFPTANIDTTALALPPNGVYPVIASISGRTVNGVMNIGHRPSINQSSTLRTAEVHLFDFHENLYDKYLEVRPLQRIRGEQKFPSLAALQDQIKQDIRTARQFLSQPSRTEPVAVSAG